MANLVNKAKTHCPQGHPLVKGNLLLSALKIGKRSCLRCRQIRDKMKRNPNGNISPSVLNSQKTHCKNGHELSGKNLIPSFLRIGKRACRICRNQRMLNKSKTPEIKEYKKKWSEKNRTKLRTYSKKWRVTNPEKARMWDRTHREQYKERQRRFAQKPERRAYLRVWNNSKYANNQEFRTKKLVQNAEWRAENPRSGAGYTIEEQIAMNQRRKIDNNQCQWQIKNPETGKSKICGIKHSKKNSIHVNHIFARSKYPKLRADPRYMICFCVEHHYQWHHAKKDPFALMIKSKANRNMKDKNQKILGSPSP